MINDPKKNIMIKDWEITDMNVATEIRPISREMTN